jgi:small subunit ribosomal protein S1
LSWDKPGDAAVQEYEKGQTVQVKILDVDPEKERISLGIKQLTNDPMEKLGELKKGKIVTVSVVEVQEGGLEVELSEGVRSFVRRSDLARDRGDQRPERFGVGDKVDAMITSVDKSGRRIGLSIKAREAAEEKEAVQQYGSSDSGASLGDILGAALSRAKKTVDRKSDGKRTDDKKADDKMADDSKADDEKADDKNADDKKVDAKKAGAKKAGDKKVAAKKTGDKKVTAKKAGAKKSDAKKTDEKGK